MQFGWPIRRNDKFAKFTPKSKREFDALADKVNRLKQSGVIANESEGLLFLFLTTKFGVDEHSFVDCITDGGNDLGVDAIYISQFGDVPQINVIQSKYHTSERKAANPFKAADLRKFRDFLRAVKDRTADLSAISNPILQERIIEIRGLTEDSFPMFKLWCISNGQRCKAIEFEDFTKEVSVSDAEVDEFHLTEFFDFCIANKSKRTDHAFFTHGNEVVQFSGGLVKGTLGLISAEELFKVIDDITEPGKIDYGIFDMNIRGFLGSDNQINRQIYRSAYSENNSRFWCLNNGITITCSRYEVRRMSGNPKIAAKDLRIVNGAQTCSAIYQAFVDGGRDSEKFKNLAVSFRLYETNDPDFVDDIAISSNSQNRVNSRDLKANHSYQFQIEQELANRGIVYLRKRGITDQSNVPASMPVLDGLKVGQIILSYMRRQPERAKRDSDQIFESMYEHIFAQVDYTELAFSIGLYFRILDHRDVVEDELRIRDWKVVPRDFITYGVFHVLFACRVLVLRSSAYRSDPSQLVEDAIDLVEQVVKDSGSPAYYTFFRKPNTAELIAQHGIQLTLF